MKIKLRNKMALAFAFAVVATGIAAENTKVGSKRPAGMSVVEYITNKKYGGHVVKPNTGRGRVAIVNRSQLVPDSAFVKIADQIRIMLKISISVANSAGDAQIVIDVADRKDARALAIYPEDCLAEINVSALAKDNPSPSKLAERSVKEVIRAFAYVGGFASSPSCVGTLIDSITSLKRLDEANVRIPNDMSMRCYRYLERSGVEPFVLATYAKACQDGWAPVPTNEFQKAIWDKVHAIPTKPIKIEFDPKTDRK